MAKSRTLFKRFLQCYGAISVGMFLFGFLTALKAGLPL